MKSITVFIMLDACRQDYINKTDTPFLYKLQSKGFSVPIKPTFGFEPDAAYFAGLYPDEADGGAQFWHYPSDSPFKIAKLLPKTLNRLPVIPKKIIRKLLVKKARLSCSAPNISTAEIPFELLSRFSFPVKHGLDHPLFCGDNQTIFDLLRTSGKKWLFHASPNHRVNVSAVLKRAETELNPPLDFAFFHIGNLDGAGHKFGPDSVEIKKELKYVDHHLETLYKISATRFDTVHFLVMGDHGMVKVQDTIDLTSMLKALPLKHGKDYLWFPDSTMARFWFFSDTAKIIISEKLSTVKGGTIIGKKEKDKYHLNYSHNRFGDINFLAAPGKLIFPNNYQSKSHVLGMHGYSPDCFGQQAVFIIDSDKSKQLNTDTAVDMRRIFPTLCRLLDVNIPQTCGLTGMV